jgi:hypothetical protein
MANLINKARDVSQKMEEGVFTAPIANDKIQGGSTAAQFPVKFGGRNRRDDMMRMKAEMMNPATGMSKFGEVTATDADFKWLAKKQEQVEEANYDSWFGKNFHKNDLASREFAQEIHPEYYSKREAEMTERAKMALRIRLIEFRGPKNEKDLQLQYLLNTGQINLGPNWDKIGPAMTILTQAQDLANSGAALKRGLFSLPRFQDFNAQQGRAVDPDNPFNNPLPQGAPAFGPKYTGEGGFVSGGPAEQFATTYM